MPFAVAATSDTSAASTASPPAPNSAARSEVLSASTPSSGLASEPMPMLRPSITPEAKPTFRGSARWAITTSG